MINPYELQNSLSKKVEKGWGHEIWMVNNEKYCGKILHFDSKAKFSMHYHLNKDETWFVNNGRFLLKWINTETAEMVSQELTEGMTWHNPPLQPHQLICMEPNSSITEVSTADSVEDNYRIAPGDSQKSLPQIEEENAD